MDPEAVIDLSVSGAVSSGPALASPTARPGEDEVIARLFAPMAGQSGLGLRDDAALFVPEPGTDLVLTADGLVAGVHFFPDDPPEAIAAKALCVNLSDLAAKGAEPRAFLMTLALPPDWRMDWLERFAAGLAEASRAGQCPLAGGDTVKTPGPLSVSITAIGAVPTGTMVHRFGARAGDLVFVSGTIGDAAIGLQARLTPDAMWVQTLSDEARRHLLDRYLHPRPRAMLARAVREAAHGSMDVSDGLIGDCMKMLAASGVSAEIDLDAVPVSAAANEAIAAYPGLADMAVTGGDDYEILCTVPASRARDFMAQATAAHVPVTCIGTVLAPGEAPRFLRAGCPTAFTHRSYSHF